MVWAKGVLGLGLSFRPHFRVRQCWKVSCFYQCIMLIPVVFIALTPCLECWEPRLFLCASRVGHGGIKSHGSPHQSDCCRDGLCQSSFSSIRRLLQKSNSWCSPFGSLTLSSWKSLCQIMRWNFLIMLLFRYDWPSFRTTNVCTGVCLNVTSVFCFNKAVDIWTLCD